MYSAETVRYYELEHAGFGDDLDLYLSYARTLGGPILELGCGTGRVLGPLLGAGYSVTGVDSSEAMLDRAREKLGARAEWLRLVHTDLATLDGLDDETYKLAYCALNTWSHLHDLDEALRALRAVRRVLLPAGLLVLDLEDPEAALPGRGELILAGVFSQDGAVVTKQTARVYEPATGTEQVTVIWDEVVEGSVRRTVSRSRMRPYRRAELEQLLARAGLSVVDSFGSWSLEPYRGQGDRLILVAQKTGE
ncbi:MAG: class I SAM-dependent methyltransferase [Chloroflexota bacterium]|nr:class I SAM-dependent methyltransferase [Chloroflexota bacterium]